MGAQRKRGKFLGFSNRHSTTVGLIRNINTGTVSPQYRVIYDDLHQTVPNPVNGEVKSSQYLDIEKNTSDSSDRRRNISRRDV